MPTIYSVSRLHHDIISERVSCSFSINILLSEFRFFTPLYTPVYTYRESHRVYRSQTRKNPIKYGGLCSFMLFFIRCFVDHVLTSWLLVEHHVDNEWWPHIRHTDWNKVTVVFATSIILPYILGGVWYGDQHYLWGFYYSHHTRYISICLNISCKKFLFGLLSLRYRHMAEKTIRYRPTRQQNVYSTTIVPFQLLSITLVWLDDKIT